MAEAIIVMTILGIIATIMITNLKPSEFRDKALQIQAKKILREIDEATQQIMINNTQNGKLDTLYKPDTLEFLNYGATEITIPNSLGKLYRKYMVSVRNTNLIASNSICLKINDSYNASGHFMILKSGACVQIAPYSYYLNVNTVFPGDPTRFIFDNSQYLYHIMYDVNDEEEPNIRGKDQFIITVNKDGIMYD